MSDKLIHIRRKKLARLQPGHVAVVKLKPDVYDMLVDVANKSASSLQDAASEIIRQVIENNLIKYDEEDAC